MCLTLLNILCLLFQDDSGSHCLPGESEEQRKQREKMETEMNRAAWEHGHPDYRGAASMDNILKKIDSTLKSPESGKSCLSRCRRQTQDFPF